ncbi:DUF6527 family protein [Sphingobium boeckii]|uniref:Uncharacterized protein n=1 Tax=Sphingobium boeckii TaxID=1082345 RepID=A0A7W9AGA9_9SPHN|nr:DUF6527 family protein [Sphingobium boeckii]MBB5684971.1 hypothetical protein [Sphingobium boeckii]
MQHTVLEHRFVEHFPETLEPGVLYVSLEFGSAAHSCCCGCGEEVVTPLTPTDWDITYDGETITLHPSVGSWTLPCRSHYVIRRGRVIEAPPWTDAEIAAERRRDGRAKASHFGQNEFNPAPSSLPEVTVGAARAPEPPVGHWWQRLLAWWCSVRN